MPCFVALIALMAPRLALLLVFVFSDYIYDATGNVLWNILGFLFMPLTLLAFAFAHHQGGVSGIYLVLVIIAALVDLGLIGGGAKSGAGMKKK